MENMKEQAVLYTQDFVRINSYETAGKVEIINLAKSIIEKETIANVEIYDMDTNEPFLIAKILCENPEFKLLLEGHLDVVSPEGMDDPFNPIIKDGIMHGRGTCDMKSGCAAMLSAFISCSKELEKDRTQQKGDIYFVFTSDEEYAGENIKKILKEGLIPKVDYTIIPEPSTLQICNAHKGETWLQVEFFGKSAHSSDPTLGDNAIYMASEFMSHIPELTATYNESRHEQFGVQTISVGVIEGGSSPNVVPPYAKITIDKRYLPGQDVEASKNEVDDIIEKCKANNPKFNAKTTVLGNWNSLYTSTETEDFKAIRKILTDYIGEEKDLVFWGGWGEGGYINMYDIPTIYLGPGELRFAHTPVEQVNVIEIEQCSEIYYKLIKHFCCQ